MSDVIYARPLDPPTSPSEFMEFAKGASGCLDLYRVQWKKSFLASNGARVLCWYRAPDAESARMALRQLGSDLNGVWSGTPWQPDGAPSLDEVDVVAELDTQPGAETLADSLTKGDVDLVQHVASVDGKRSVLLLRAGDTQGAVAALGAAGLDPRQVWRCTPLSRRNQ